MVFQLEAFSQDFQIILNKNTADDAQRLEVELESERKTSKWIEEQIENTCSIEENLFFYRLQRARIPRKMIILFTKNKLLHTSEKKIKALAERFSTQKYFSSLN